MSPGGCSDGRNTTSTMTIEWHNPATGGTHDRDRRVDLPVVSRPGRHALLSATAANGRCARASSPCAGSASRCSKRSPASTAACSAAFAAWSRRPGLLTVAFLQGRRKPYIGPVVAVPRHERAVLRDGVADRRHRLLDAARLASPHAAVERPRPGAGRAPAGRVADDSRAVCAALRRRRSRCTRDR